MWFINRINTLNTTIVLYSHGAHDAHYIANKTLKSNPIDYWLPNPMKFNLQANEKWPINNKCNFDKLHEICVEIGEKI
jgi:hypothetical protein